MKLPRFVLSLRTLMLAVLVSGLILGLIAYRFVLDRRRAELRLEVARQFELTDKLVTKAFSEFQASSMGQASQPNGSSIFLGATGGGCNDSGWNRDLRLDSKGKNGRVSLIDMQIHEESIDTKLQPIVIKDRGGVENSKIVEQLTKLYREKGWTYRILPDELSLKRTKEQPSDQRD